MRRLLGKLAKGIPQTHKARAARRAVSRPPLQVEALEARELPSTTPGLLLALDPIQAKYRSLGGPSGFLGTPLTGELKTTNSHGSGRYERFQHGAIYYSAATGAHDFYGAIANEYVKAASEKDANGTVVQSLLGFPTSDEARWPGVSGGLVGHFQGGVIYDSPATGAHVVYGGIGVKYNSVGGPASYGLPTSDEASVPGVPGERVSYFQYGHAIYWSPATGAHLVYGAILAEYQATALETDADGRDVQAHLGAPTSDEMGVPGVPGARMNTFQGGAIYWSPATGAHVVYGAIGVKYNSVGGPTPTSGIGLPTSDEADVPGRPGYRVTYFEDGIAIYWSPQTGAYLVGLIV
jgi:uncharacterized protein with LGFP repeats